MGPDAIDLRRFVIARSPLCGVLIARDGTAALHQGSVVENAIGACVQREGFDVAGISDAVVYRDNGTNLQTTELPVPSAVGDLLP